MKSSGGSGQRRSLWIPWTIGACVAVFVTATFTFIYLAARSDPGLVAGSPPRLAGTNLTPTAAAPALDLRVVERLPGGGAVVEARLRGKDGRPARAESVAGTLQRATHRQDDAAVAFSPLPDGVWRATVRPPTAGGWDLAVEAHGDDGRASASLRL